MEENKEVTTDETQKTFLTQLDEKLESIKKKVEEYDVLVKRHEEIATRNLLGGKTDNATPIPAVKEESNVEYAKRFMAGK